VNDESNFLSRWSRRKVQAREGVAPPEPPAAPAATGNAAPPLPPVTVAPPATLPALSVDTAAAPAAAAPERSQPPPPTLADVDTLTRESDFSRFVAPGVDGEVKNAALKKLFADPHFNVMDGLDTYIDDYSKPDPLPASMLRKMAQAAFLGLVDPEPPSAAGAAAIPEAAVAPVAVTPTAQAPNAEVEPAPLGSATTPEPDEDTDLRLQPHDAAGRGGAENGAAADIERQP
jgi:hypothetical protein